MFKVHWNAKRKKERKKEIKRGTLYNTTCHSGMVYRHLPPRTFAPPLFLIGWTSAPSRICRPGQLPLHCFADPNNCPFIVLQTRTFAPLLTSIYRPRQLPFHYSFIIQYHSLQTVTANHKQLL